VKGLLLIPALMAAVVVYAIFDSDSGIRTLAQVRANVAAAEGRIDAIRRSISESKRQVAALSDDPFAIESAIRADLALVKPGEQVVRLSGAEDSNPRFP
jgi:cell division protein FtsB